MLITVTAGEKTVYLQELDSSDTLKVLIAHLMEQAPGEQIVTKITNNGHEMAFKSASLDIEKLVRKTNNIVVRTIARKTAAA